MAGHSVTSLQCTHDLENGQKNGQRKEVFLSTLKDDTGREEEEEKKNERARKNDVSVDDVNDDEKKMCRRKKKKWNAGMHVKKSLKKGGETRIFLKDFSF